MERATESELESPEGVRPVDLTSLERLTRGRLPIIEAIAERYVREMRTWLMRELRTNATHGAATVAVQRFHQLTSSLVAPSTLVVFRLMPHRTSGVLVVSPAFADAILELSLGARIPKKAPQKKPRSPSAIESAIIGRTAASLLETFGHVAAADLPFEPSVTTIETNPLALTFGHPSDQLCCIAIRMIAESGTPDLLIALPLPALGSAGERSAIHRAAPLDHDPSRSRKKLAGALIQVPVNLRVVLGHATMKYGAILALQKGDVIRLETGIEAGAEVWVENVLRFSGDLGTAGGNHAVTIRREVKR